MGIIETKTSADSSHEGFFVIQGQFPLRHATKLLLVWCPIQVVDIKTEEVEMERSYNHIENTNEYVISTNRRLGLHWQAGSEDVKHEAS